MVAVDIQLSASHTGWPTLRAASLAAEESGSYGVLWVLDHLAGVAMGGTRSLECFTWLGALAEATDRIELGVLVANVWNRQVGTLAVAASSVTAISGRRCWLGLGAGASPRSGFATEQFAVGADPCDDMAERHARVEEVLALTDEMWATDRPARLATFPQPVPPPPRIVGVNSVSLSRLAGRRADGINVRWEDPRRGEFLEAAREAAAGRPFVYTAWARWDPVLLDDAHPRRREMADLGIDRLVLTAVDDVEQVLAHHLPS